MTNQSQETIGSADSGNVRWRLIVFRTIWAAFFVAGIYLAFSTQTPGWALIVAMTSVVLWFVDAWIASFDPKIEKEEFVLIAQREDEPLLPEFQRLKDHAAAMKKYPFQAYLAVLCALKFKPETLVFEERVSHISAAELTRRFVHYVADQYPNDVAHILREWQISSPTDIGVMVYEMVGLGLMRANEGDRPEDFLNVRDFEQYGKKGHD